MKKLMRTRCEITGDSDIELLHVFRRFPVFMGCTNQSPELDLRQDMSWCISRGSGLIQLQQLLPLDVLYPESHCAGAIGKLWELHHREFASFVFDWNPLAVLEIGGAHGILATEYQELSEIPWTVLEPNPSPVPSCRARFIKGFFDEDFSYEDRFDAVVHSHVFEHIYHPSDFINRLSHFVPNGKMMIFSVPNMEIMMEKKYTNCINFEHTVFLTEPYIEYLLSKYGFRVLKKKYFMSDHSIFYAALRDDNIEPISLPSGQYEKNRALYEKYIRYHESLISELNHTIESTCHPVYLFGAHVFSQYLIEMGLRQDKIVCLLDNASEKRGRRLYGTKLNVASPSVLAGVDTPLIVLKAGVYNEEVRRDIIENINNSAIFLD